MSDDLAFWKAQAKKCRTDLLQSYDDKLHCDPATAQKVSRLKAGLNLALGAVRGFAADNGKSSD